jgi:hypothetical protein
VVSLAAYGVLDLLGTTLVGGADLAPRAPDSFRTGDPEALEWLYPAIAALKGLGLGAVVAVWFFGSAVMLGAAWASARMYWIFFEARLGAPDRRRRAGARVPELPRPIHRR